MLEHGPGEPGLVLPLPSFSSTRSRPGESFPFLLKSCGQGLPSPGVLSAGRGGCISLCPAPGGAGGPFAPRPHLFGSPPARPRSAWSRRMLRELVWGRSHVSKSPSCAPNRPQQPFLRARGAQPASPCPKPPPDSPYPSRAKPQNHTTRPPNAQTDAPRPFSPPRRPPPHPHLPKSLLQLQVECALLHHRLLHPPARSILPRSPRTTRTPPSTPFFFLCAGVPPVRPCPPAASPCAAVTCARRLLFPPRAQLAPRFPVPPTLP